MIRNSERCHIWSICNITRYFWTWSHVLQMKGVVRRTIFQFTWLFLQGERSINASLTFYDINTPRDDICVSAIGNLRRLNLVEYRGRSTSTFSSCFLVLSFCSSGPTLLRCECIQRIESTCLQSRATFPKFLFIFTAQRYSAWVQRLLCKTYNLMCLELCQFYVFCDIYNYSNPLELHVDIMYSCRSFSQNISCW